MTKITKKDINKFYQKAGLDVLKLINVYCLQIRTMKKEKAFDKQNMKLVNNHYIYITRLDGHSLDTYSICSKFIKFCIFERHTSAALLKTRLVRLENSDKYITYMDVSLPRDCEPLNGIFPVQIENKWYDVLCQATKKTKRRTVYSCSFRPFYDAVYF